MASVLRPLGLALFLLLPCAAHAEGAVVTLKLAASPVTLTGRLVSDTGAHYRVATRFGVVEVAKSAATCRGCSPEVVARAD